MIDLQTETQAVILKLQEEMARTTNPTKLTNLNIAYENLFLLLKNYSQVRAPIDYGVVVSQHHYYNHERSGTKWTTNGPKVRNADGELATMLLGRLLGSDDKNYGVDAVDFDNATRYPPRIITGYNKRALVAVFESRGKAYVADEHNYRMFNCSWLPVKNTTNADINMVLDVAFTTEYHATPTDWSNKADFFVFTPDQTNANRQSISSLSVQSNLLTYEPTAAGITAWEGRENVTVTIPADKTVLLCLMSRPAYGDSGANYRSYINRNEWRNIGNYLADPTSGLVCDKQLLKQIFMQNHTESYEAWTKTEDKEPTIPVWSNMYSGADV